MKWICKKDILSGMHCWKGKRCNIKYTIEESRKGDYFCWGRHIKEDLSFNSLWGNIRFSTFEDAKHFCEDLNLEGIKKFRETYENKISIK